MATKQELQTQLVHMTEQLCTANIELAHLRAKLADRDALARKLIAGNNRAAKSPRRAAMEAARAEAMKSGVNVVVQGELHV